MKFRAGDKVTLGDNDRANYILKWRKENGYREPLAGVVLEVRTAFTNGNIDFIGYGECWEGDAFKLVNKTPSIATDLSLKPQAKTVLRHLRKKGHISPAEALIVYSISRLAASIYDIRKVGYEVTVEIKRDAQGHKYAKYTMAKAN